MNRFLPFLLLITFFGLSIFFFDVRSKQLENLNSVKTTQRDIKKVPTPTPYLFTEEGLWRVVNNWKYGNDGYYYEENSVLCKYAEIRVSEIKSNFSHIGFRNLNDKIYKESKLGELGENLSKDFFSFESELLDRWLNSPTHKKNLEYDFTHSCIKCRDGYCVQLFGKY